MLLTIQLIEQLRLLGFITLGMIIFAVLIKSTKNWREKGENSYVPYVSNFFERLNVGKQPTRNIIIGFLGVLIIFGIGALSFLFEKNDGNVKCKFSTEVISINGSMVYALAVEKGDYELIENNTRIEREIMDGGTTEKGIDSSNNMPKTEVGDFDRLSVYKANDTFFYIKHLQQTDVFIDTSIVEYHYKEGSYTDYLNGNTIILEPTKNGKATSEEVYRRQFESRLSNYLKPNSFSISSNMSSQIEINLEVSHDQAKMLFKTIKDGLIQIKGEIKNEYCNETQ